MQTNQPTKEALHQQIKDVLFETIKILFPVNIDPNNLIRPHNWRDREYVGEKDGRVVTWRGYSANLTKVDSRYRAVYIDLVDNVLPQAERVRLFGEDFAEAISNLSNFVVMFVSGFPYEALEAIKDEGFIPRKMTRVLHPCIIARIDEFIALPALCWAAKIARLILFQRTLSAHLKPLDADEVALQNLLYRSGYLHSYIVENGLELHKLNAPSETGEFSHDLHAIVKNPEIRSSKPFPLGIELYTGPIGYHVNTVPQYINQFHLKGMIIIAKDDPWSALSEVSSSFHFPIISANKLSQIGSGSSVAIHHLPLEKVILDLATLRDELESFVPT